MVFSVSIRAGQLKMENVLKYLAEWLEDAPNTAPEERATVADLRLFILDQNVTLHLRENESADHVTISLYSLAEGLIHDWWNLFGGRDREISLIRHRNGYVVPDVRMTFDGTVFQISAHQCAYVNPDVRFWAGPTETMSRWDAETVLRRFVENVLDRLDSRQLPRTSAALRWARVKESMASPAEAEFCEAAGALGLDPYQLTEESADVIEHAATLFQAEALPEFLAGSSFANRQALMHWIERVEHRPASYARIGELREVAREAEFRAPARNFEESWALGYRRARALRGVLGLVGRDRFRSFRTLAEKLGASKAYALAGSVDGLRALRSDHPEGTYIHMRTHGESPGARNQHLFSFARAVGDAVCFPRGGRAAVNELRNAYRQSAGRAFAAEFLAPIEEVSSMLEDGRDTVSIADEFGVATTVIERQWENRARIKSVCAA
jgi:hypothetical protein